MRVLKPESSKLRIAVGAVAVLAIAADLLRHHSAVERVLGAVLIVVLAEVTVTDLEERRIPNALVAPATVAAILIGLLMHPSGVPGQAFWGVVAGAFLLIFAVIYPAGLGMGDVKLALVLGVFLSRAVIVAIVVGFVASALFSIGVLVARGLARGRKTAIPLGPFLALGGVVAVLAGPWHVI